MRRRTANKFQGVTVVSDRHGKLRHRLRRTVEGRRIDCYLPGPFGSVEFIAAYEEAMAGARSTAARTATDTVAYLVDRYIASRPFRDLAGTTQSAKLGRMDWIRRMVGDVRYADLEPRHIAALMEKKGGPAAANRLKKDLGQIYRHAAKAAGYTGRNPAALADSHKTDSDGFHTWTDGEIAAYREHHASGTMPRLALEIFLGTGAARQDAAALTRTNIRGGKLTYRRGKTGQAVTVPIVPELAAEISQVPPDRLVLITKRSGRTLSADTLGRSFRAWCAKAGLPAKCTAHGLRKAGARRLAEASATEYEIMAFLGHANPTVAAHYCAAANRGTMAAAGVAKLRSVGGNELSNLESRLDKRGS